MFQGRMPVEKRNLILEYENCHPTVLATIAYGSGAIPQQNSSCKDKKQIDLIEVVDDLEETIVEHMIQHPENFTPSTLRFFQKDTLNQLDWVLLSYILLTILLKVKRSNGDLFLNNNF